MRFSVRHLASLKNVKVTFRNARVLALAIGFSACSPAIAQDEACRANLNLLGQDLISMLRKIPAMPPIAQIYTPVRRLYEEAKYARVSVFKWFETDGLISQRRDWLIGFKV